MLDNLFEERLESGDLITIGDSVLLIETSTINPPVNFNQILQNIQRKGYRPMLAHPERYRYLNMDDYSRLQQSGTLFQLNLPSLLGFYGETARSKAEKLLNRGAYCRFGTDCHRTIALGELYSRKELSPSVAADLIKLKDDAEKHPVAG
jgi:tyrosine-protein phosphatase YwqE